MGEEKKIEQRPLSLDDLFGGTTIITEIIKGWKVRFHFRELDAETDLKYQRRLSLRQGKGEKVEAADDALEADSWLFDRLCTKVEAINGEEIVDVPDYRTRLAPDTKRMTLMHYRQARAPEVHTEDSKGN